MKKFGIISAILGVLALAFGMYVQFVVVENAAIAEIKIDYAINSIDYEDDYLSYYKTEEYRENFKAIEKRTDMGIASLFIGIAILIAGLIPAIKKAPLGWLGVAGGLIALVIGIINGTHMF